MTNVDLPIQQITEAPAIMKTRDPTAKRNLVNTTHTHQWRTCNNTPGAVPVITRATSTVIHPNIVTPLLTQKLTRLKKQMMYPTVEFTQGPLIIPPYSIPGGVRASARLISQQALNAITMCEAINAPEAFTPQHFVCRAYEDQLLNYALFASPMIHPTTGKMITSYKRLMNDPETAETWKMVFGKDFGF
jgi:hypothetical protein